MLALRNRAYKAWQALQIHLRNEGIDPLIDQERDPEMDPLINDVLGAIFPIFSALGLHSVAPMMRDPSFNEPPIFWGRKGQILMTFLMVVAAVTTTFGIVWMFLVIGWLRTIILLVVVGWLGRTIYRRLPSAGAGSALAFIVSDAVLCGATVAAWLRW